MNHYYIIDIPCWEAEEVLGFVFSSVLVFCCCSPLPPTSPISLIELQRRLIHNHFSYGHLQLPLCCFFPGLCSLLNGKTQESGKKCKTWFLVRTASFWLLFHLCLTDVFFSLLLKKNPQNFNCTKFPGKNLKPIMVADEAYVTYLKHGIVCVVMNEKQNLYFRHA